MKTVASWTQVIAIYALAFIVNPWIAGVLLVSHVAYEWFDFQEQRNLFMKLQQFKQLDNHEHEEDVGNC